MFRTRCADTALHGLLDRVKFRVGRLGRLRVRGIHHSERRRNQSKNRDRVGAGISPPALCSPSSFFGLVAAPVSGPGVVAPPPLGGSEATWVGPSLVVSDESLTVDPFLFVELEASFAGGDCVVG